MIAKARLLKRFCRNAFFIGLWACLLPLTAIAQNLPQPPVVITVDIDPSTLSDQELLDLIDWLEAQELSRPRPVSILGIPSGFGAPRGVVFASGALTNRRDRQILGDVDGSFAFGFGFGNARNGIGVTPLVDITSVTPRKFGSSGKVSVKLSRELSFAERWVGSAALDLENLVTWGDSNVLDRTWTLSYSAVRPAGPRARVPLMYTLGYGSGVADRGTTDGVFGGIGLGLSEYVGVSLAWYGDEAIGGLSIWPDDEKNMQISLGIGDITNRVQGRRLLFAVSFSAPWRSLFGVND